MRTNDYQSRTISRAIGSFTIGASAMLFSACSLSQLLPDNFQVSKAHFLSSGTMIISQPVVATNYSPSTDLPVTVGYLPPQMGFEGAANEYWIDIRTDQQTITLFNGSGEISTVNFQGAKNYADQASVTSLAEGTYLLIGKKLSPRWHAPDSYFESRGLPLPSPNDPSRDLRGAYGNQAIFLTPDFAIHSAPLWTNDVGGFRVESRDLTMLFEKLEEGAVVRVR